MSFLIENKIRTFHYLLIWLVYAFIHSLSLQWIIDLPFWILFFDGFIHAVMFAFFGIILWNVMLYGNYEKMPSLQRVINYSALALLVIVLWIGIGYGWDYLFFGKESAVSFLPVLPLYIFIGILLYLIILLYFRMKIAGIEEQEESLRIMEEEGHAVPEEKREVTDDSEELLERIAVKSGHKIHVILIPDIMYLQADGDYVHIFTQDGKYMKEQTMKYFEENLPTAQFVRVHRSYIVNIESISRIEQYEKQNQLLTLKNGHHIKVSIAGYKLLKSKLGL